jgi:ribokinase
MLAVVQPPVRLERPEESLLERILRSLRAQPAPKEPKHLCLMLFVEALEGWDCHGVHHGLQRRGARICEHAAVRAAVVGHVEWIEFVPVEHVPRQGEIVSAPESWTQAAGGGSVAAIQLAKLADSVLFFTTLGADEPGRLAKAQLDERGIEVHAAFVEKPQRKGFTFLDETGERTITTIGPKIGPRGHDDTLPWHELARCDAVYFCAGDADALLSARRGRVLVATARELATLGRGAVELDALVGSGKDEAELYRPGDLDPEPRLVVTTSGALGGWAQPGGPFSAAPLPPIPADSYGAGDCFAAGLAFALAAGLARAEALDFAARCGAGALAGRGVHAEAIPLP